MSTQQDKHHVSKSMNSPVKVPMNVCNTFLGLHGQTALQGSPKQLSVEGDWSSNLEQSKIKETGWLVLTLYNSATHTHYVFLILQACWCWADGPGSLAVNQRNKKMGQPQHSLLQKLQCRTAWTSFSPLCLSWGCSQWRQGLQLCPEAWPQRLPPLFPHWWDRSAGRWGGPGHSAPPTAASATQSTCCWCLLYSSHTSCLHLQIHKPGSHLNMTGSKKW